MGYKREEITIYAHLSSHNDERDERDQATFERLRDEIEAGEL